MTIHLEKELRELLPHLMLGGFVAEVLVEASSDALMALLTDEIKRLEPQLTPESIRAMSTVKANKDAYRKLGKDPNRYRPAAESLLRRVANGKGLYHINNVVDILNLISVKTGFSICGYDLDTIDGDITMGIGAANEPYEGIGRGELNVERLPIFRDQIGGFGTPTSDSVRTMVSEKTKRYLMIIIGFEGKASIEQALNETRQLLQQYADGSVVERFFIE